MSRYARTGRAALLSVVLAAGCGERPEGWDQPVSVQHVAGLSGAVAMVDESIHRVSLVAIGKDLSLDTRHQPTGVGIASVKPSPDGQKLYVLARGVQPRLGPDDDRPALWVYDGTGKGDLLARYELDAPLDGLTVDPLGQFVVVHPSGSSGAFVENPNELVIIDVTQPASSTNPVLRTLRSFGGTPQRLTFTDPLMLPAGERRLLIVETDQEVSLLDLDNLDRPEVTVVLNSADGTTNVKPAEVAVDEGDADKANDTRVAIRTNQSGVFLLTLAELPPGKQAYNDFDVVVNIIGLSGVPSDIGFVRTDAGRRLAVLEPQHSRASLVDPETTVVTTVDLPTSYGSMAVVTDRAGGSGDESDVALLWGGDSSAIGVAFWSLGKSVGQPYRSIEVLTGVASSVARVVDVPAPNDVLKLLIPQAFGGGQVYVLDMQHRTASPLFTYSSSVEMEVSDDGLRAWFYVPGTSSLARIDLETLHPVNLYLDRTTKAVFDVTTQGGGRAAVALHPTGAWGATVFDATQPDDATAARHVGILQGGF
ncbi:MAG TPA: hypothetical protein PLI95_04575 [Polyangiaceae bacterium]|nr:hypothetical protein [Polyangiaceae bacterium]